MGKQLSVWIKHPLQTLHAVAENDVTTSHVNFFVAGLFGVIVHPSFYLMYKMWFPLEFDPMALRAIGVGSCVLIMLHRFWPTSAKPYLPYCWYFVLFFNLPYYTTVMLIQNDFSTMWYLGSMLAIFFLTVLVLEWFIIVLLVLLGVTLGVSTALFLSSESVFSAEHLQHVPVFILAMVAGIIFNQRYKKGLIAQEKLKIVTSVSNIAHELRTPLLGIKSSALGLKYYLPILMKGYQLARESNLPAPEIPEVHYKKLELVLERIESEGDYSHAIIDMLLASVNPNFIDFEKFSHYSISACVDMALERYLFKSDNERTLIRWAPDEDFRFFGSDIYMVHIMINLLRNAIYAVRQKPNEEIKVWLETGGEKNYLYVHDTGIGIPKDILPNIFQRFFTTTKGTGVGLTFCREAMQKFGGEIHCESKEGEYTTFILEFPVLHDD